MRVAIEFIVPTPYTMALMRLIAFSLSFVAARCASLRRNNSGGEKSDPDRRLGSGRAPGSLPSSTTSTARRRNRCWDGTSATSSAISARADVERLAGLAPSLRRAVPEDLHERTARQSDEGEVEVDLGQILQLRDGSAGQSVDPELELSPQMASVGVERPVKVTDNNAAVMQA